MIEFDTRDNCCGCTSCASICPVDAITMTPDVMGFKYPLVDYSKCIRCGVCAISCVWQRGYDAKNEIVPPEIYASRMIDHSELLRSQSGGLFYAIAKLFIERGGVVYGAAIGDDFITKHIRVTTIDELQKLRGSKYVQSEMDGILRKVKRDLIDGVEVLFSGTTCQISAATSFVGEKLLGNLLRCDIICHGVCAPQISKEHRIYISALHGKKITAINYRDKVKGWGAPSYLSFTFDGGEKHYDEIYLDLFLRDITTRESCGACRYTNFDRPSDISLGDFWGIENLSTTFANDNKGCSLVIISTDKGRRYFQQISEQVESLAATKEQCLQPILQEPFKIPYERGLFEIEYIRNGYAKTAKKISKLEVEDLPEPQRVGILTLTLHDNYGGLLQAYALQKVLRDNGYYPFTINRCNVVPSETPISQGSPKEPTFWERLSQKNFKLFKKFTLAERRKRFLKRNQAEISSHTWCFIREYINVIDEFPDDIIERYNLRKVVVGSDQVWRLEYSQNIRTAFLDFAKDKDIRRVAYAASFGLDYCQYPSTLLKELSPLLQKFDAVSVREDSGIDICRDNFGVDAIQNLDPTLLLERSDYIKIIVNGCAKASSGELMTYILDWSSQKRAMINKVAKHTRLKVFHGMPNTYAENKLVFKMTDFTYKSVSEWLRGFWDAKFIVTDSFHGALFSIIFNKPFVVISNKERGAARFNSLMSLVGLEHRMIDNVNELTPALIDTPIDFIRVNNIIAKERDRSIEWLLNSLNR